VLLDYGLGVGGHAHESEVRFANCCCPSRQWLHKNAVEGWTS
jgi:hypothetical protein